MNFRLKSKLFILVVIVLMKFAISSLGEVGMIDFICEIHSSFVGLKDSSGLILKLRFIIPRLIPNIFMTSTYLTLPTFVHLI